MIEVSKPINIISKEEQRLANQVAQSILRKIEIKLQSHTELVFGLSVSGTREIQRESLSNKSQKSEQEHSLS